MLILPWYTMTDYEWCDYFNWVYELHDLKKRVELIRPTYLCLKTRVLYEGLKQTGTGLASEQHQWWQNELGCTKCVAQIYELN